MTNVKDIYEINWSDRADKLVQPFYEKIHPILIASKILFLILHFECCSFYYPLFFLRFVLFFPFQKNYFNFQWHFLSSVARTKCAQCLDSLQNGCQANIMDNVNIRAVQCFIFNIFCCQLNDKIIKMIEKYNWVFTS